MAPGKDGNAGAETPGGNPAGKSSANSSRTPPAARHSGANNLELAIGHEVRARRKKLELTVADLAKAAGMSIGMLSKIENGNISPSLATLQALSRALGIPVTALFRRFEDARQAVFVKAGAGTDIERRGSGAGHRYALLGHMGDSSDGIVVEPCLVELTAPSDALPAFQHDGMEFLYMLEGEVKYRHGDTLYTLQPGDSLFFDADVAHGPEVLSKLPIRYLSVASFSRSRRESEL